MLVLLLGTGIFLTIRLRGLQIRALPYSLYLALIKCKEDSEKPGDITHFQALMTTLAATVGGSLLLAAIGRVCYPTSKRNWFQGWARHTSLSFLLRMSINKLDSQHFWDQMDALPTEAIPLIEEDIVNTLIEKQKVTLGTLLYDTTNFFTYIDSTNERCSLAQRGRNKQKRMDLRQFGWFLFSF